MEFKNKMKMRICTMAAYVVIGAVMCILGYSGTVENDYVITWGAALSICGFVKIIQLALIMRNPEKMEERSIAEKDERNIMLMDKASRVAFAAYIMAASIAIAILYLINLPFAGQIVAYTACGFIVIYLISYFILKRKY